MCGWASSGCHLAAHPLSCCLMARAPLCLRSRASRRGGSKQPHACHWASITCTVLLKPTPGTDPLTLHPAHPPPLSSLHAHGSGGHAHTTLGVKFIARRSALGAGVAEMPRRVSGVLRMLCGERELWETTGVSGIPVGYVALSDCDV